LAAVIVLRAGTIAAWATMRQPGASPDSGVAAAAGVLGLLLLAWVGLIAITTAVAELLPQGAAAATAARRLSERAAPAIVRKSLVLMIGTALITGAAPALASPASTATAGPGTRTGVVTATSAPAPGWLAGQNDPLDPGWSATPGFDPTWQQPIPIGTEAGPPTTPSQSSGRATLAGHQLPSPILDPSWGAPGRLRASAQPEEAVVVRRGDTLWDIAARHLGPAATDAEIAQAWPHWYQANRDLIGSDPDLLLPGQRLLPPTTGGPL
jgi:nucleoid-associated protein YgaU